MILNVTLVVGCWSLVVGLWSLVFGCRGTGCGRMSTADAMYRVPTADWLQIILKL